MFARVAHVLLPKDHVRFRLTANYAIDRAGGSGTIDGDVAAALDSDWESHPCRKRCERS